MKIADVRAWVHEFPVTIPLLDKPIERRRVVFCEVETDDGYVGYGLTGHYMPLSVATALKRELLPVVKGMDPREVEAVHAAVSRRLNPRAMTGVVSSALSCIDIAAWDIAGKAAGRTVAQLLGGARDWAPTYVTFGFPQYDSDRLVQCARDMVAHGHRRLKMVVGVCPEGPMEDARRIRLVREAVGEDVELMIDANNKFTSVQAQILCRAVEDCHLTWFEEPVHQNDARAMADLRNRTNIPISAGQNEGHRWRLRELVENRAVDILQPNVCYCGGYTEARKAAHLAQAFNLPIANGGGWPLFNMHTMAGLDNGWRVEFHLGMWQVGERLFVDPPRPRANAVYIPDAPGLGLVPDEGTLRDTRVAANEDC